jgi:tetratricopeptide (TPR) repeat protein
LGMALSRFAEMTAAREAFEKATELNPKLAEPRLNLGLLLAQAGNFGSAGEELDLAIQSQGEVRSAAYSHLLRAKIWVAQQESGKAISELQQAVKLRPDYARAWSELGSLLYIRGNPGALEALERAVALDPEDEMAQYRLGKQYLHGGYPDKAVSHLSAALQHNSDDPGILYNLALALRRSGQNAQANRVDERLSKNLQNTHKTTDAGLAIANLIDAGQALEKSGNIQAALEKYRSALDLSPMDPVLRLDYGLALCRLGDWRQGAVELQEVLRLDPNNAKAAKALYIAIDNEKNH